MKFCKIGHGPTIQLGILFVVVSDIYLVDNSISIISCRKYNTFSTNITGRGCEAFSCLTVIIFGTTSHSNNLICSHLVWDLRRVLIAGNEWKQNILNLVELSTIIYTRPKTLRLLFEIKYILRCQTATIYRDIILTIFSETYMEWLQIANKIRQTWSICLMKTRHR